MFRIYVIPQPNTKLYYYGMNKFVIDKEEARLYETREEAIKATLMFEDLDMQIEKVED